MVIKPMEHRIFHPACRAFCEPSELFSIDVSVPVRQTCLFEGVTEIFSRNLFSGRRRFSSFRRTHQIIRATRPLPLDSLFTGAQERYPSISAARNLSSSSSASNVSAVAVSVLLESPARHATSRTTGIPDQVLIAAEVFPAALRHAVPGANGYSMIVRKQKHQSIHLSATHTV